MPLLKDELLFITLMKSLTDLAQQFADGLITATEFRDHLAIRLIAIQDESELFLLCTLLLRTEAVQ